MRRVVLISLLPLCAVGARHLAEWLVLGPALERARSDLVLSSRSHQLDVVLKLRPDARRRVLARMGEELSHGPRALRAAAGDLAACGLDPRRCAAADLALRSELQRSGARLRRLELLSIGVAAFTGLTLALCGIALARRLWGRHRAGLGLAVLGAALGLAGGARLVWRVEQQVVAVHLEAQRDRWVTRARLALGLPAGVRREELAQAVAGLRRTGATGLGELEAGVARCTATACPREGVLVPLARIYGASPEGAGRGGWLDRWLLWLGAAALALVPPSRLSRRP